MKKRGFGSGRWNGVGGKVEEGETIEDAARREAYEEVGVVVGDMDHVADLSFTFLHKEDWNQRVHVYMTTDFAGTPKETEEMAPQWFTPETIPYDTMWPDDIFWLPQVLEGKLVRAAFSFSEGDVIVDNNVEEVASL